MSHSLPRFVWETRQFSSRLSFHTNFKFEIRLKIERYTFKTETECKSQRAQIKHISFKGHILQSQVEHPHT